MIIKKSEITNTIENYFKTNFRFDLKAGFITAIVALPLAIAFAVASGVSPILGIYTAIIAGILGSNFGGSKFIIYAPTSILVVIILSTINDFGIEGLLVAGFLAGIILIIFGLLKLGKIIKYIPLPIVSGFTAGMGLIIFIRQLPNFFGIKIPLQEHFWQTLNLIYLKLNLINYITISIAIITILMLVYLPNIFMRYKYLKDIPISIITLILVTTFVSLFSLNIPIVGEISYSIPKFTLSSINFELIKDIFPVSFTIAFICAFESLLCASLVDGMKSTKTNSDKELISQGILNSLLPLIGGIVVTSSFSRTVVNVDEGARTRFSAIFHAIFILIIILLLGSFAKDLPLAFISGLLIYFSFRMINFKEIKTIIKISKADTAVFFVTFFLTIFTNLIFAVQVAIFLTMILIFIKLTEIIDISSNLDSDLEEYDKDEDKIKELPKQFKNQVQVYTINGPFFFGAMNIFEDKISEQITFNTKYIILRMKFVPFIDSTGVQRLKDFILKQKKKKIKVLIVGMKLDVKTKLFADPKFKKIIDKNQLFERTTNALEFIEKN